MKCFVVVYRDVSCFVVTSVDGCLDTAVGVSCVPGRARPSGLLGCYFCPHGGLLVLFVRGLGLACKQNAIDYAASHNTSNVCYIDYIRRCIRYPTTVPTFLFPTRTRCRFPRPQATAAVITMITTTPGCLFTSKSLTTSSCGLSPKTAGLRWPNGTRSWSRTSGSAGSTRPGCTRSSTPTAA